VAVRCTLCTKNTASVYNALTVHFKFAKDEKWKHTTDDLLYHMYSSHENKLIPVYLRPILNELNRVNKLFEHEQVSPVQAFDEVFKL